MTTHKPMTAEEMAKKVWKQMFPDTVGHYPDAAGVRIIKEALLSFHAQESEPLVEALDGVIRVADRRTIEFDAAKEALANHRNKFQKEKT